MGMYTELFLGVELIENVPQEVIDVLTVVCGGKRLEEVQYERDKAVTETVFVSVEQLPEKSRQHFEGYERLWNLGAKSSYYFQADPVGILRHDWQGSWYLTLRGDIKNYNNELPFFLKWLQPYVRPDFFAGYIRYEEALVPTLVFYTKDGLHFLTADEVAVADALNLRSY